MSVTHACVSCSTYFSPRKNSIFMLETMDDGVTPYKVWQADLWECPDCATQLITGYGRYCISEHYEPDFNEWLARVTHTIKGCPRRLQ